MGNGEKMISASCFRRSERLWPETLTVTAERGAYFAQLRSGSLFFLSPCGSCTRLHNPGPRLRPSFAASSSVRKTEGAGNAGCSMHPQPRVQDKKHTSKSPQVHRNVTAFPA